MSGIGGICDLAGAPADPWTLRTMMQAVAHRGPDGSGSWFDGPVALGHVMLHSTPESVGEIQPFADPATGLCVTLDGRVDNGAELCTALKRKGYETRGCADSELVLLAYACWGEDCAREILGDFAFAVWDSRKQTLFCARDQIGIRPFYYAIDRRRFIFGSELQQLFAGTGLAGEPNEGMIGEYLANAITSRDETLYRGILRLPPAHCLCVRRGAVVRKRYWDIDPARAIRYRTDAEYAEHFMSVFKESVRCRLRSHRPIGVELSGGLDSSSIVSVVQLLRREGAIPQIDVEACSLVFPGMECDESTYIQDVVAKSGVDSVLLTPPVPEASCHQEYVRRHLDFPTYPRSHMWNLALSRTRDRGGVVLLSGIGGDDWLAGAPPGYLDMIRESKFGDLLHFLRRAHEDAQWVGLASALRREVRSRVVSALPPAALRVVRTILRRRGVPDWIDPGLARRSHLQERLERVRPPRSFATPHLRQYYSWLNSGYLPHSLEYGDRLCAVAGIETRQPFHDRRIVEMGFALPGEQTWRRDQSKVVLRKAMKGLLPESVRQRVTKAEFSEPEAEALRALGGELLLDSLAPNSMRWVDKDQVRARCQQVMQLYARGDEKYKSLMAPLWMVFGIDLWYKICIEKSWPRRSISERLGDSHEGSAERKDGAGPAGRAT